MKTEAPIVDLKRENRPFEIVLGLADGDGTYATMTIPHSVLSKLNFKKYNGYVAMAEAVAEAVGISEAWEEIAARNPETVVYDAKEEVATITFSCDDEDIGSHIHRFGQSANDEPLVDEMPDLLDLVVSLEVVA